MIKYIKNNYDEHHVILSKYGEDIYIDETTIKSHYPTEEGRIENVVYISGNLTGHEDNSLILTQDAVVELRDVCNLIIEKETKRNLIIK
jgi:hypothetical protein